MSDSIRFVVFDLGGVVCTFDPEARLRAYERLTGMSAREIDDAIWGSGLEAAAERGEIDPSTLRVLLAGALGGKLDADAIRAAWSLAFVPDEEVLSLVDRVARLGAEPSEIFFVDDSHANVDAAHALGWRAEVFDGLDELERSLEAAGFLEP